MTEDLRHLGKDGQLAVDDVQIRVAEPRAFDLDDYLAGTGLRDRYVFQDERLRSEFEENGYLILPSFLEAGEVDRLKGVYQETKGEQTPCNMTHDFQVDAAKVGIAEAGGTPREFTTISVSDGISMNHEGMKFSLVSRELIADSIEAVVHGLAYDALIGFGGCDT